MSDPSARSGNTQYIGNIQDGGGGGGGTPNVAIAGTNASGNPIASPVLGGDAGNQNVTQVGDNTNTGFRSAVFGSNNNNNDDYSLIGGSSNTNTAQNNLVTGSGNNVSNTSNAVSGDNHTVGSDRNAVSGNGHVLELGSSGNDVSGSANTLENNSVLNKVSGTNHQLSESIQNDISGNGHVLSQVVNSRISGFSHDVAPLSGTGADYNDISGNNHFVRGDGNRVSGQNNNVQAISSDVSGTGHNVQASECSVDGSSNTVGPDATSSKTSGNGHTTNGKYADVSGEGNKAHFGQIVKGRFAVENVVSDTVPTAGQKVEIVGWGTDSANRKNIRTLDDVGNEELASSLTVGTNPAAGGGSVNLIANASGMASYFFRNTAAVLRFLFRFEDAFDALTIGTRNDDGSLRSTRMVIPRSDALPVRIDKGLNLLSGSTLQCGGTDVMSSGNGFFLQKIGYNAGQGTAVTQLTNKSTGVSFSSGKKTGNVTMNAAALASQTTVSFTLTSDQILAEDMVLVQHISGGTLGAYGFAATCAAGSVSIAVRNLTAGSLSEAIVLKIFILKSQTA